MTNDIPGFAVYFEFRQEARGYWSQFFLVTEMISPMDGKIIPQMMVSRQISEANPQRRWKFSIDMDQKSFATVKPDIKEFAFLGSGEDAAKAAIQYFGTHLNTIDATTNGDWVPYLEPIVIEVTPQDASVLQSIKVPRALLDRIKRVRTAKDFDALPEK